MIQIRSLVIFLFIFLPMLCYGQIYGYITIFVEGPVKLFVVDAQGQKAGYDPTTNEYYNEIPNTAHGPMGFDSQVPGEKPIEGWDFAFSESIDYPFQETYRMKIYGIKRWI
ncbi:MAG: hypothetical protein P8184_19135 [Calditrichia bacterium]